jgi:ribose/xylose/arabinose/galactoside ABC-type transport system permease subunit
MKTLSNPEIEREMVKRASNKQKTDNLFIKHFNSILLIVLITFSFVFFSLKNSSFYSLNNIITILSTLSAIAIVCIGQTLLLISGTFDLSVGSIVGFSGVLLAKIIEYFKVESLGVSILVFLFVILIGGIIGLLNGLLVTKIGINALITTIAMMTIIIGFSLFITKGNFIGLSTSFYLKIGTLNVFNVIPIALLIAIVGYLLFFVLLKTTIFGRYIYAIGNNRVAASYVGVNVKRIEVYLFMISGSLSSLAGILLASKLTNAQAILGEGYPILSIAACVLGGCLMAGGKGGVLGTFLGVVFLMIIKNGLSMIGFEQYIQDLVTGVVLIFALFISELIQKRYSKNK